MLFIENLGSLIARRSLYCIWVPAREGETTPLVARWIDPQAEGPERHEDDDSCSKEDARETWLGMNLRFARLSRSSLAGWWAPSANGGSARRA
jgi:hypothetical protein